MENRIRDAGTMPGTCTVKADAGLVSLAINLYIWKFCLWQGHLLETET